MRQALQQLGASFLFGILSILLIIGGLTTALAEKSINQPPTPKITKTSLPTRDTQTGFTETPVSSGLVPSPSSMPGSPTNTLTATLPPSTVCPAPAGWSSYIVQPGDTLESLAGRYNTTPATLKEKNCLVSNDLLPDTRLYMPPYPTATPIPCGAPASWILRYTVQAGDNLYRIGLKYRVSVAQLQQANCLGYSTRIKVGQILKVPNVPTSTPETTATATPSKTPSPTLTPSNTPTIESPTPLPATETFTPTPTNTATETPTESPTPEKTETAT